MQAIAYTRVSTTRQAEEGVSLAAQHGAINKWCESQGHYIDGRFTDEGISGKKTKNRPGITAALTAVCQCKGILVVYSLSRMSRSLIDMAQIAERINKAGAQLASCTESFNTTTANGRLIFGFFGLMAQWEREMIGERTRMALAHKRAKGKKTGSIAPYGFRYDGEDMLTNPDEVLTMERMARWRQMGYSYQKIANCLHVDGLLSRSGGKWSAKVVRGILKR